MKNKKIIATLGLATMLIFNSALPAFADQFNVVTLGADLSQDQKDKILKYFNVKPNEYQLITINNKEEREALKDIAPLSEIGTKTISCAYVQPTSSGGINVKTTNLTWVTASMIQNALVTAGVKDANVIAAAPFAVSGTGALTGILKGFEDATDEKLNAEKKELANKELQVTGDLAKNDNIGKDKAAAIVNDVKTEIIKENTKDTNQVAQTINNITNNYGVTLSEEQKNELTALMEKIAKQDYDYSQIKETLNQVSKNLSDTLKQAGEEMKKSGFFQNLLTKIKDFFNNEANLPNSEDLGIINSTDNNALGNDTLTTGSNSTISTETPNNKSNTDTDLWNTFTNWLSNLFK